MKTPDPGRQRKTRRSTPKKSPVASPKRPGSTANATAPKTAGRRAKKKSLPDARSLPDWLYPGFLDDLPIGVCVTAIDGTITYTNHELDQISEASLRGFSHETVNSNWRVEHPDGREFLPEEFPASIAMRRREIVEDVHVVGYRMDGSAQHTLVTSIPLFDARDQIIGAVSFIQSMDKIWTFRPRPGKSAPRKP